MGESWAWVALPGVYWGMEVARRRPLLGILLVSSMYASLLLSHNITALWGSLFIATYSLLTARDLKWPLTVAGGGLLGAAMSAFFWYPALKLAKLTQKAGDVAAMWGTPKDLHWQSIFWRQYFVEALGYGARIPGTDDSLGVNLGFAVIVSVALSAIALFQRGLETRQRYRIALFLLLTFLVLFIMSPQMPWNKVPGIFLYLQFPWRLLIFTAFFGASVVAMASPVVDRWTHPAILTGLAVVFAIPTLPMILMPQVIRKMPHEQLVRWNRRYERKGLYAGSAIQEFMPKWVRGDYLNPVFLEQHPIPENRVTVVSGDLVCDSYIHEGTAYKYNLQGIRKYRSSACAFLLAWMGTAG
jgi:hypothetical protein